MHIRRSILLLMLLPAISFAADKGTALKADTLRSQPYSDAKTAGSLARGERVDILSKQGGWLKVKTAKSTGWVRLLSVKRGTTASSASGQVSGALNVASGRAGTGQVVATTGVRGLSAEELKSAKFNENEIKQLESFEESRTTAQRFASEGGLKATKFSYLPAPGANK
jgi:uncharacterized protein YgiM (DUF1202 family)